MPIIIGKQNKITDHQAESLKYKLSDVSNDALVIRGSIMY